MTNHRQTVEKHMNFWLVWNYEREQERLDALSARGLHLTEPGTFRSTYAVDHDARYIYRLDFQPDTRKKGVRDEYLGLYEDAGWTYLGQCQNWHYFRRPWTPEKTPELYTDKASLKQHYRRIQRVLALVLVAEILIMAFNVSNLTQLPQPHFSKVTVTAVIVLLAAVVVLLACGCLVIQKRLKDIDRRK